MLNRNAKSSAIGLAPDLKGKTFNFPPLSMTLVLDFFFVDALYQVEEIP